MIHWGSMVCYTWLATRLFESRAESRWENPRFAIQGDILQDGAQKSRAKAFSCRTEKWLNSMVYGTLWLFNIAMENGPFMDGLPIKNGDFPWLC